MIEMLGVLAIIGVLSAGGVWGYNMAMTNHQANKLIADINLMMVNSQNFFTKQAYIKKASTIYVSSLCNLGIVTKDYCKDFVTPASGCETVPNPFGGCVDIRISFARPGSAWGNGLGRIDPSLPSAALRFWGLSQVPKGVCVKLLTNDWSKTTIEATAYSDGEGGSYFRVPVSPAVAKRKCVPTASRGIDLYMNFYWFGTLIKE